MNTRIRNCTLALLIFLSLKSFSQSNTLTIEQCYELAKKNYPLIEQKELLLKSKEFSIANIRSGYLPQVAIYAQGTYQSEVTRLPGPATLVEPLSKDQYKVYADVNQNLFDGGAIKNQSAVQHANTLVEDQKLEVEIYKINDRINQIFFGVLMMDQQTNQIGLLEKDLLASITKVEAAIVNGMAFKMNADILNAELLKVEQRKIEVQANRKTFLDMLGIFIGQELNTETLLGKPIAVDISSEVLVTRPELALYNFQLQLLASQYQLTNTKILPKIALFAQGGYGRPGLNVLKNEFATYYIGGLRMSWNLSGFYNSKRERQLLDVNLLSVGAQKKTFLFNTNMLLQQQLNEITKFQELVTVDQKIIVLRERIKATAQAQLDNGVITANDYLRELNAEDLAKENLIFHETQLLMNQYSLKTTRGN